MTSEKPQNGLHTEYFDNGQKESERHYKDGFLDGKWKQWYENGQLSIVGSYKRTELDGKWKQWYENGQLAVEGSYKDSKPEGSWLHHVYEDKNLKLEKKDGSLRYWKFVVNAAVRYGEILDKKNSGLVKLQFVGKHIENQRDSNITRKVFDGSITINKNIYKNTRYVFQSKQLITYHPISNNPDAYKNKLGGLVDYLMYSERNIDKKRLASFYHECYKKNPIITAGELIERDVTDQALKILYEQKQAVTTELRDALRDKERGALLSEIEQVDTDEAKEIAEELKAKISDIKEERILQEEDKEDQIALGKDVTVVKESFILVNVDRVKHGRYDNLCIRLTFDDDTYKYLKIETWDRDGVIESKAKALIGKEVRTTCWDPVGTTKWSDMNYFNNIFKV